MEPVDDVEVEAEAAEAGREGPTSEQDEVLRWRLAQILSLGIGGLDAQLLAETGADLGLLRKLVGRGCPPPLAARIAL